MHALQVGLMLLDSNGTMASIVAGPVPDESVALSQELLAKLGTLPEDAQAVSHFLKQGHLPVLHGNFEALEHMTKQLVVGSSGRLATFFSDKIQNSGLLDATGKPLVHAAHMANRLFTSHSCSADFLLLLRNRRNLCLHR